MNRREAYAFFNISAEITDDGLSELLEQRLFELKSELLIRPGIPAWIAMRQRQILRMAEASFVLGYDKSSALDDSPAYQLDTTDPIVFLRSYEGALSRVKKEISGSQSFTDIIRILSAWRELQLQYSSSFQVVLASFIQNNDEDVLQVNAMDTAPVIRSLVSGQDEGLAEVISREWSRIRDWH
jgi:hypothetical protein